MITKLTYSKLLILAIIGLFLFSCNTKNEPHKSNSIPIIGTWELLSATTIEGNNVQVKNMTDKKMIKIINETHFAFFNHDMIKEKDSLNYYMSGGGTYKLIENRYTEFLEYCCVLKNLTQQI